MSLASVCQVRAALRYWSICLMFDKFHVYLLCFGLFLVVQSLFEVCIRSRPLPLPHIEDGRHKRLEGLHLCQLGVSVQNTQNNEMQFTAIFAS